jgi:hypothetical protein
MAAVELTIEVPDINLVMDQFSVIRVFQGPSADGPWAVITDTTEQPAVISSDLDEPYDVIGKDIQLKLNENAAVSLEFSGATETLAAAAVMDAINSAYIQAAQSIVAWVTGELLNSFKLQSNISGRESRLEVLGGTAVEDLGLSIGAVQGLSRHVVLYSNINQYTFVDLRGDVDAWYCVDYLNLDTGECSEKSTAFQGSPHVLAPANKLSKMTITITDVEGKPLEDVRIDFFLREALTKQTFGVVAGKTYCVTDGNGYAEINLVRGIKLRAVVSGTDFIRDFTVPDADEFDLMDVTADAPDLFEVVKSTKIFAVRRS